MEKVICKSCSATEDIEEFDGFETCNECREAKRKCYGQNKNECNQARREERPQGSQLCEECGHRIKHENWDAHFHYALHPKSELNVLMKGYLRRLGNLRKEGNIQAKIKAEYEKQEREIRKRLNEQFQKNLDDEPHPETEQPNPILLKYLIMCISY